MGADVHEGGNEEGPRTGSGGPAGGVDQETADRTTEVRAAADRAAADRAAADRVTEDQEEFLALERELTVLLRRARASSGEMAREVHPDLESSAYGLLVRLEERGRQRATELAAYIGVGKATMSRQLRALEEVGLVAREPDPADGRAWLVHLTQEGRERFRVVRAARRARYVRELASWERGEVADLARLLRRLNRGVERG